MTSYTNGPDPRQALCTLHHITPHEMIFLIGSKFAFFPVTFTHLRVLMCHVCLLGTGTILSVMTRCARSAWERHTRICEYTQTPVVHDYFKDKHVINLGSVRNLQNNGIGPPAAGDLSARCVSRDQMIRSFACARDLLLLTRCTQHGYSSWGA